MPSYSADESDARDLRCRAELFLKNSPRHGPLTLPEMQAQLYELQVHQIELEMQNEELRRSKHEVEAGAARYADFYDLAPVGYVSLDRAGNVSSANFALARMLGTERGALLGARFCLFVAEADRLAFAEIFAQVFDSGAEQSCELTLLSPKPLAVAAPTVAMRAVRSPDALQCQAVLMDISEQSALKSAEVDMREALQAASDAVWISDLQGHLSFANPAAHQLLGYASGEYLTMQIADLLPKELLPELPAHLQRLQLEPSVRQEWPLQRKDGSVVVTELVAQRLGSQRLMAIVRDVGERKRAEAALDASEVFAKATLDASASHIVVLDPAGVVLAVNKAWRDFWDQNTCAGQSGAYGQSCAYGLGVNYLSLCRVAEGPGSEEAQQMAKGIAQVLQGTRQEFSLDYPCHSASEQRWFQVTVTRFPGTSGNLVVAHENITARMLLQQSREAEQLAQRNAMVRQVHHSIKNNLQGVMGLLREFGYRYPQMQEAITQVLGQVQSVAVIHGLQGRSVHGQVRLCELTAAVAEGIGALWQTPIEVAMPQPWLTCPVAPQDAVPMALVLNELIFNAVKHRDPTGSPVREALQKTAEPGEVQISIVNSGQWKDGPARGPARGPAGAGVGLELVAALLPQCGAQLSRRCEGAQVHTVLLLAPPVLEITGH